MSAKCISSRDRTAQPLSSLLCLLGIYFQNFQSRKNLEEVGLFTMTLRTECGMFCCSGKTGAVKIDSSFSPASFRPRFCISLKQLRLGVSSCLPLWILLANQLAFKLACHYRKEEPVSPPPASLPSSFTYQHFLPKP